MLENFRTNTISLEKGGTYYVTLGAFVVAERVSSGSGMPSSPTATSESAPALRRTNTYHASTSNQVSANAQVIDGSVRVTREQLAEVRPNRAVNNQYAMV